MDACEPLTGFEPAYRRLEGFRVIHYATGASGERASLSPQLLLLYHIVYRAVNPRSSPVVDETTSTVNGIVSVSVYKGISFGLCSYFFNPPNVDNHVSVRQNHLTYFAMNSNIPSSAFSLMRMSIHGSNFVLPGLMDTVFTLPSWSITNAAAGKTFKDVPTATM